MTLTGPTVALVPLSLDQLGDFLKYSGEPSLWTWWLRKPPVDAATMTEEIETALAQQRLGQRVPFAIFHRERNEHIGSTSFRFPDPQHRSVEIGGTWLALPFHRTPINRECKELLLTCAFDELGMNRVMLRTDELNVRSRRAIEKLGARFEGIMRQDMIVWDGRIRSSAIYSLLRDEWRARRSA